MNYEQKLKQDNPEKYEIYKVKKMLYQTLWRNTMDGKRKGKESYHRSKINNPVSFLLRQAKRRAKVKKLEFNLTKEDIIIPDKCPIMNLKLEYKPYKFYEYSPSLDRIDNSKGYIKGNIQVISTLANRMKWNSTEQQLIQFAQGILSARGL